MHIVSRYHILLRILDMQEDPTQHISVVQRVENKIELLVGMIIHWGGAGINV